MGRAVVEPFPSVIAVYDPGIPYEPGLSKVS